MEGRRCPTKTFLSVLSSNPAVRRNLGLTDEDGRSSSVALYGKYLRDRDLGAINPELFFGERRRTRPQFLDVFNPYNSVSLASTAGINFVIYSKTPRRAARKLVDTRGIAAFRSDIDGPTLFFRLGKNRDFEEVHPDAAAVEYSAEEAEGSLNGGSIVRAADFGGDHLLALVALLGNTKSGWSPRETLAETREVGGAGDPAELVIRLLAPRSRRLLERLLGQGGCMILAVHLAGRSTSRRRAVSRDDHDFCIIGRFPRDALPLPGGETTVVFCPPGSYYLPNARGKEAILKSSKGRGAMARGAWRPLPPADGSPPPSPGSPPAPSPCDCDCCAVEGRMYARNFPKRPAQKPARADPTIPDLLKAVNLSSESNLSAYRRACAMSSSLFDCESMTVPASSGGPALVGELEDDVPLPPISDLRHAPGPRRLQRVIAIGYRDETSAESEIFLVSRERDLAATVADFLAFVRARADELEARKRRLMRDMLGPLAALRRKAIDEALRLGETRERADRAFGGTLHGLLLRRLNALSRYLALNAFYGSRYDFPALLPALVSACSILTDDGRLAVDGGRGGRVSLGYRKDGNRVRRVRFKGALSGISMEDPALLLDGSVSLARLCEMCGLPLSKLHFPFGQLRSLDSLSSPPSWEPADWVDPLSGGVADAAAIAAARERFESGGMSTLLDLLADYLRADVDIGHRSVLAMHDMFYELLGVHAIDSRKHTISSLSSAACALFLHRAKRPAVYRPSVPLIYGPVKRGSRGGLTQVALNDASGGPINAHLYGDGSEGYVAFAEAVARGRGGGSRAVDAVLDSVPLPLNLGLKTCDPDVSGDDLVRCARELDVALGGDPAAPLEGTPVDGDSVICLDIESQYAASCEYSSSIEMSGWSPLGVTIRT